MNLSDQIKRTKRPYLISGPCSAETEEQVHRVCADIAQLTDTSLLRAGIWKPRTRPDSFEGIGEKGLQWYVEAGKKAGLPTSTEVANSKHVELALKAGIDVLWVGARTTVNPFAVQEIVDALRGTQTPVMIKNPVNPDLSLWLGAFERFQKAGLTDLTAIHRGFSIYKHPKYRNVPSWEIPISFKQNLPEIPMICDPSHITGKRDLLAEVSQKAMDLNFDGLIIETHPTPDQAWSDAEQQITPERLKELMSNLVLREKIITGSLTEELDDFRQKIAVLDDRIFEILSARMKLSEEVGIFKQKNNITILQEEHWKTVIESRLAKADEYFLTQIFVKNLMDNIHQESIRHQVKVMNPDLKKP
ncbi:MAG: 3-deoxy-7-phosphoheptulonate synthase [Crocinitomicaceae bacterium]|jgi:chorismate mutase|nr:3-deoxy-7-phosphoheptulonate synthase [Crocinitomicaceae bacterium]